MRVLGVLVVPVLLLAPAASEAYSMTAAIETQTRGLLDCGRPTGGPEEARIFGVGEEFSVPGADATGGEPGFSAAERKPLVILKDIDRCSPLLFKALATGEKLPRVEVRLFDPRGVHFFTIRLEHAVVTRMAMKVRTRGLHEEIAFAFQIIHLVDELTGVSASHDFAG